MKAITKQVVLEELKEIFVIFLYLAACLSILQTYKSLVLLQLGINDFLHGYEMAFVEALLFCKIVVIAQKLPFLQVKDRRSLASAIVYQSVAMTLCVDVAGKIEDVLFPHTAKLVAESGNPLVLMITHQLASLSIFLVLFTVRGIDTALGKGTLVRLLFKPPAASKEEAAEGTPSGSEPT